MSDREQAQIICNATSHKWVEEYYGYKCENCGEFIPYGCEPWLPFDDDEECADCDGDEFDPHRDTDWDNQ